MQLSLVHHTYKTCIGKSELTGQAMGGFENLSLPCVGKGIEPGILFLVELAGIQPYHPDCASSTAQSSLLSHVRDTATLATMESNNQVKVSGEEDKFEVSKCKDLCSSFWCRWMLSSMSRSRKWSYDH